MHATAFLADPGQVELGSVVVLHGTDRFLMQAAVAEISRRVLGSGDEDDELGLVRFEGKSVDLQTVCDELSTVSMWGDRRLVVIDEADPFITQHRGALERLLERPPKKSVLVLLVKTWPKTTRLAKRVPQIGLALECAALAGASLVRWLVDQARIGHGKQLGRDAAALMTELAGNELGLLMQELSKLAAYVGDRSRIELEDVPMVVGGWKTETTWAMLDAARGGDLGTALSHLDKLLSAGEAPQKTLGGINFVFRKLATATALASHGAPLNAALAQAGCFPRDISGSATYLRRIGRPQAERLFSLLLVADGDMKGNTRISERIQLERLIVQLSGPM